MYVEKDSTGHIIIQGLTPEDAEMLDDCLCCYLAGDPIGCESTEAERRLIELKRQLQKLY